jgi:sulfofructose kinase
MTDNNETARVLGVGWLLLDSILLLPQYPEEDTKSESQRDLQQVGGPVPRALSALSALGIATRVAAVCGDDAQGILCAESLEKRGVSTADLQVVAGGETRKAHVWVSSHNASRTIAYSRGDLPALDRAALSHSLSGVEVFHSDGRELQVAVPLAKELHNKGATVVVDAGGWKPHLDTLLVHADYLVASRNVLASIGDGDPLVQAADIRDALGLRAVVITAGTHGAWILSETGYEHLPSPHVSSLDTNGAGDVFAGGLIFGLLKDVDLRSCVEFGSALAAIACGHFGDYFASASQVHELLPSLDHSTIWTNDRGTPSGDTMWQ